MYVPFHSDHLLLFQLLAAYFANLRTSQLAGSPGTCIPQSSFERGLETNTRARGPPGYRARKADLYTKSLTQLDRHLVLLISILRYSLSWIRFNYYSTTAQTCYRLSFVAAAVTYGIVIYKTFRARQKVGAKHPAGPLGLLADENVQYFGELS